MQLDPLGCKLHGELGRRESGQVHGLSGLRVISKLWPFAAIVWVTNTILSIHPFTSKLLRLYSYMSLALDVAIAHRNTVRVASVPGLPRLRAHAREKLNIQKPRKSGEGLG